MIKRVIFLPHKKLRKISQQVHLPLSVEDEKIAQNLIFYLDLAEKNDNLRAGIGISAVQLGFLKKMFLVKFKHQGQEEHELLINPKIEAYSQTYIALRSGEGCLSIDDTHKGQDGLVHRRNKIIISGYSYFQKKNVTLSKVGFSAIVYQHEMDHLEGHLFIDKINKNDPWKQKSDELLIY